MKQTLHLLPGIFLLLAATLPAQAASPRNPMPDADSRQLFIGEQIAVAPTCHGKVRGFILRGIYQFRGIPYGAPTSGENRFMPPQPPQPWEGIRPAVAFGDSAPQRYYDRRPESYSMFVDHWNYDGMSEDCLRLNVWTPGLDGKRRRSSSGCTAAASLAATASNRTATTARISPATETSSSVRSIIASARWASRISPGSAERSTPHRATWGCSTSWRPSNGCATISRLSRRPAECHDHGPVGRRCESVQPLRHAVGQGAFPQGRGPERECDPRQFERVRRSARLGHSPRGGSRSLADRFAAADALGGVYVPCRACRTASDEMPGVGQRGGFAPVGDGRDLPDGEFSRGVTAPGERMSRCCSARHFTSGIPTATTPNWNRSQWKVWSSI